MTPADSTPHSTTLAQIERAALADLLVKLGPDEPTLCEGWDTGDLLAHLLLRERRADAAAALALPFLRDWSAKVQAGYRHSPWQQQIDKFRSGPPGWNPMSLPAVDEKINGAEMFIHHEDARRGQPDWQPRELEAAVREAVIALLPSWLLTRSIRREGIALTAVLTDRPGAEQQVVLVAAKPGATGPAVEIRGGAAEVLLWEAGRSAIRVEWTGPEKLVAQLRETNR